MTRPNNLADRVFACITARQSITRDEIAATLGIPSGTRLKQCLSHLRHDERIVCEQLHRGLWGSDKVRYSLPVPILLPTMRLGSSYQWHASGTRPNQIRRSAA